VGTYTGPYQYKFSKYKSCVRSPRRTPQLSLSGSVFAAASREAGKHYSLILVHGLYIKQHRIKETGSRDELGLS
jgi:hypothetical protein